MLSEVLDRFSGDCLTEGDIHDVFFLNDKLTGVTDDGVKVGQNLLNGGNPVN